MADKIVDFVIQLAVVLFAISFHESAHAWSALKLGDTTAKDLGRISLNPLRHIDPFGSVILPMLLYFTSGLIFGHAKPTPVDLRNTRNPRVANLIVSGAGPISYLLLCTIGIIPLIILRRVSEGGTASETVMAPLWAVATTFVIVNFSLGIFNLIPIPPLDGSWVAASIFGPPVELFFRHLARFGFLIIIMLSYLGVLGAIMRPVFGAFQALLQRVLA